ncbi:hypothetical protein ACIBHX_05915 [Nonomuraea sp. NPDC050536]|uniref:hypothetical protein n=1 Tax=Nonomuraea sp. NPDC050536 TaxID=3364366 RepID=UPI0037CBC983
MLLFVFLVVGVCGMHTLGHVTPSSGMAMSAREHLQGAPSTASDDHRMPDPSSVCLAVLVPLLVLTLIAAAGLARRTREEPSDGEIVALPVARPPPQPIITLLSVLRI